MDARSGASETIDSTRANLIALSHRIHANPEIAFEEIHASDWISSMLDDAGFTVQRGALGLETAFLARFGKGPLHIAMCAEYDALPGIGHACGHNMIAAMSAGAGIGLAKVADEVGITVHVIGTPAEESGGGKILLLERGAFDDIHFSMMVHPTPFDAVTPRLIAAVEFEVNFHGKESHSAFAPEQGINAADAMTLGQTAIGLLRQHLLPTEFIHGIVVKGGDAPNIIPAHTRARYVARATTQDQLANLRPKVHRCFEAGALATGCRLEITGGDRPYAHVTHDSEVAAIYRQNAERLGRRFHEISDTTSRVGPSTDMGNISQRIPSIHPFIGIDSLPAANHQREFAAYCVRQAADQAVYDGATAMAWTGIDAALDPAIRARLLRQTP